MKRVAISTSCITQAISRLPAVATLTWADQAASVLAHVLPGAGAGLMVGSLDACGFLTQVEVSGACRNQTDWPSDTHPYLDGVADGFVATAPGSDDGLAALRNAFIVGEWVGWSLGPITPRTLATTTAGLAGLRRAESPVWKRWSAVEGVADIVAGVSAVPGPGESRVVLAEIACPGRPDAELVRADADMAAAVLEAVLPMLAERIAAAFVTADRSEWLTEREAEVLAHLLEGENVPDIAAILGRSIYTVHDHVKSLHRKLGASNRGELVSRALGHIKPRAARAAEGVSERPAPVVVERITLGRSAGAAKRSRL